MDIADENRQCPSQYTLLKNNLYIYCRICISTFRFYVLQCTIRELLMEVNAYCDGQCLFAQSHQ